MDYEHGNMYTKGSERARGDLPEENESMSFWVDFEVMHDIAEFHIRTDLKEVK